MKKPIKSFISVLIAVLVCLSTFVSAFASVAIPAPTPEFYVNDFAGVFSADEKTRLMSNAVSLSEEHDGIQVVITTVKSLSGDTVENYAVNMYNKYGIGKDDMGLLILLSTGDREIRVEVGRAMETYITDSKAGQFIQDYAIPYLKENKFDEGLIHLQEALISEIVTRVTSETGTITAPSSTAGSESSISFFSALVALAVILFIALIIFIIRIIIKKIQRRKEVIATLNNTISDLEQKNSNLIAAHEEETRMLKGIINNLKEDTSNLSDKLSRKDKKFTALDDRYQRILKIYPDADEKVDAMIEAEIIEKNKKAASEVDALIATVINLSPSKDIVDKLQNAISRYSSLEEAQEQYIQSDIHKLKALYDKSLKLKEEHERKLEEERIRILTEQRKIIANDVTNKISAVISTISIARAGHLSELNSAKNLYDDLDYETQKYVDEEVISKLDSLISAAERDKRRKEDEERRRSSYNHSSSSFSSMSRSGSSMSRSSGGFRGFGGRSGGGGASAKF